MGRRLIRNVVVADQWYGPDYPDVEVTDAVAEAITNPSAWAEDEPEPESAPHQEPPKPPRKPARKR